MSKAFCCDRCLRCFNPLDMKYNERYTSMSEYFIISNDSQHTNSYEYRMENVQLCPECTKMFRQFMEGRDLVDKKLLDDLQEDVVYEETRSFDDIFESVRNKIDSLRQLIGILSDDNCCNGDSTERESKSKEDSIR